MSDPSVAVRLDGVSRSFGAVRAVDDVTLRFRRGALTLVMGPSGSGKTTLLSMVGGLLAPTQGEVEVDGTRLATLTPSALSAFRLRRVGFVFQQSRLLDALTTLENIELPLMLAGVSRPASGERARTLASRVGLTTRLDARATTLSGGEQQRAAIARALANEPPVLLADEPTGSLDSQAGQRVIGLLHKVARGGVAVLVVTHDARLERHADAIVRMEDGRVTAVEGA